MEFGEIIYNYRLLHNKTQKEIANILGITQSYYSKYELSKIKPTCEILYKICKIYNISSDDVLAKMYTKSIKVKTYKL